MQNMNKTKSPDDFDSHCKWLLKKMEKFEEEYVCKKCLTNECEHFRKDMNKHFKEEIDKNTKLVVALSKKTFKASRGQAS